MKQLFYIMAALVFSGAMTTEEITTRTDYNPKGHPKLRTETKTTYFAGIPISDSPFYVTLFVGGNFGFSASDATISFHEGWHASRTIGGNPPSYDEIVFEDFGNPWVVGAAMRHFDVNGLTIRILGDVHQLDGAWTEGSVKYYTSINNLRSGYPSSGFAADPQSKLIWLLRVNNTSFFATNAKFQGDYWDLENPTDNQGAYQYGHAVQLDQTSNVLWSGGEIYGFSGDGMKVEDYDGLTIEDVYSHFNHRNAFTITWGGVGTNGILVRRSRFEESRASNPQHGADIEPDAADEGVGNTTFLNCIFQMNDDNGLGFHLWKAEAVAGAIDINITDCYFYSNGRNEGSEGTVSGEMNLDATDISSTPGNSHAGGQITFTNCFWDRGTEKWIYSRSMDDDYDIVFNGGVVYKPQNNDQNGLIFEYQTLGISTNNHVAGGVYFNDMLFYHEVNDAIIRINRTSKTSLVQDMVTSNVTVVSPYSGSFARFTGNSAPTNNVSMSQEKFTAGTFPATTVNVTSVNANLVESTGVAATLEFTRSSADTSHPMAVLYSIATAGANAREGVNWQIHNRYVYFPPGVTSVNKTFTPKNNGQSDPNRTLTLTITPLDLYTVGANNEVVMTLSDEPCGAGCGGSSGGGGGGGNDVSGSTTTTGVIIN